MVKWSKKSAPSYDTCEDETVKYDAVQNLHFIWSNDPYKTLVFESECEIVFFAYLFCWVKIWHNLRKQLLYTMPNFDPESKYKEKRNQLYACTMLFICSCSGNAGGWLPNRVSTGIPGYGLCSEMIQNFFPFPLWKRLRKFGIPD